MVSDNEGKKIKTTKTAGLAFELTLRISVLQIATRQKGKVFPDTSNCF